MSKNEKSKQSQKIPQSSVADLQNVRIIQKNLLYVIGLSSSICDRDLLLKKEFFGQYGKIKRLVVNNTKAYNPDGINGPSYSAYVSYSTSQEASFALLSIDNTLYDGHILKASFGSTKYCLHFLRNIDCINKDCLFLHNLADDKDIINKDDTNNKNMFLQNQYLAMKICDIFNPSVKSRLTDKKNILKSAEFPTTNTIYSKEIVIEADPKNRKFKKYSDIEENYNSNKENIEKNEVLSNIESEKKEPKRVYKEDLKNLLNNRNKQNEKSNNLNLTNNNNNSSTTSIKMMENISTTSCSFNENNSDKTDKRLERNNSDYSNSSETTDNSNKKRHSIFIKREKSRFNFQTETTEESKEDNIYYSHENICDIISFKTSTYYYLKNLEVDEYINKKYKINTSEWQKILDLNKGEKVKN